VLLCEAHEVLRTPRTRVMREASPDGIIC
jgi:hypothetical protein